MTALIAVILIYNFDLPTIWYVATGVVYVIENGVRFAVFMSVQS